MIRSAFLLLCSVALAVQAATEQKTVDGVLYHLIQTPASEVKILWTDDDGVALRTFPAASRYLKAKGVQAEALMNGGIFEPGGVPSGLLIQDGRELRPVNRNAGKGNFYLEPNGIFLVGSAGAAVIRSDEYPLTGVSVQQAVQSGPLLLRKGQTHPAFRAESNNRLHRNGVGVRKDGTVVFAMTDFHSPKHPNLFEFAALFRSLGCEDALFLDGDISEMRVGAGMEKPGNSFGSFIVILESAGAK